MTPRTKWRRRIFFAVVLLVPLILALTLFFNAAGVIRSVAEATIRAHAASAMHDAIGATLSDGLGYSDLITVQKNAAGEITALSADAQRVNAIARDAAYLAQKNFATLSEAGVEVPLGAFSGIEALSGFGPPVTFKLLPVGAAHCTFRTAHSPPPAHTMEHGTCRRDL